MSSTPWLMPVGTVLAYAGTQASLAGLEDAGWLECDGRSLPRRVYSDLFAAIQTNYGAPNDDNFNIPQLHGLFLRGACGSKGAEVDPDYTLRTALQPGGGTQGNVGSYQTYGTAKPGNPFKGTVANSGVTSRNMDSGEARRAAQWNSRSDTFTATGGDMESRPPNVYVYYIIKCRILDRSQNYVVAPVGSVIPFTGSKPSSGLLGQNWVFCDGAAKGTTGDWQALYNVIQGANGSGSGTYNLPDYRGYFLRGVASGSSNDPDRTRRTAPAQGGNAGDLVSSVQTTATGLPVKSQFQTTLSNLPQDETYKAIIGTIKDVYSYNSDSVLVNVTPGGGDNESRPPNVNVDWYIRYK